MSATLETLFDQGAVTQRLAGEAKEAAHKAELAATNAHGQAELALAEARNAKRIAAGADKLAGEAHDKIDKDREFARGADRDERTNPQIAPVDTGRPVSVEFSDSTKRWIKGTIAAVVLATGGAGATKMLELMP